jgi:hypothetical protein
MSARIRQLEDALTVSHSNVSRDTHPLLQRDLLQIKSIIDLHSAIEQIADETTEVDNGRVLDVFGTLALRDDGASTFYGRSAGHEVSMSSLVNALNMNAIFSGHPSSKISLFAFRITPMTVVLVVRVREITQRCRSPQVAVPVSIFVRQILTRCPRIFLCL